MRKRKLVLEPGFTAVELWERETDVPIGVQCLIFLDWLDKIVQNRWIEWLHLSASLQGAFEFLSSSDRLNTITPVRGRHGTFLNVKGLKEAFVLLCRYSQDLERSLFKDEKRVKSINCNCVPENALGHQTDELREFAQKMLGLIAKWDLTRRGEAPCRVVSRRCLPEPSVSVWLNSRLKSEIDFVSSFREVLDDVSPLQVLRSGIDKGDGNLVLTAIRLKMRSIRKEDLPNFDWDSDLPAFFIGSEFVESFRRKEIKSEDHDLILEMCCHLILMTPTKIRDDERTLSPFRVKQESGLQKVRRGDNAKGWRLRIGEHMYRLNLWDRSKGALQQWLWELAWVEKHAWKDGKCLAKLPEGNPGAAIRFKPRSRQHR